MRWSSGHSTLNNSKRAEGQLQSFLESGVFLHLQLASVQGTRSIRSIQMSGGWETIRGCRAYNTQRLLEDIEQYNYHFLVL